MIKPDQIPDEVVMALQRCLNGCDCDECLAVCIAAALNAWPGSYRSHAILKPNIVLPLPQEARDG